MRSFAISCLVVMVASLMSLTVAAPASVELEKRNCRECQEFYRIDVRWCGRLTPPDPNCLANAKKSYDRCRRDNGCK
ncbi:hypothetical protein BGZ73_008035 [Actinomortierella ambigua]|nr:hypothetical protein BGZ73_008035 [Actinomortierella ambigua]